MPNPVAICTPQAPGFDLWIEARNQTCGDGARPYDSERK